MNVRRPTLLLFILLISFTTSHAQNYQWAKSMGGFSTDRGTSIAVDNADNVFVSGNYQNTVDFDPGAGTTNLTAAGLYDIFLLKTDGSGNLLWAKSVGGTSNDYGSSIAVDDSGNVYISGTFQGVADFDPGIGIHNLTSQGAHDVFILKLDATGNFVWVKRIGGVGIDWGNGITIDDSANVYTIGDFHATVDFDPGPGISNLTSSSQGTGSTFISKLNSAGNFIWARCFDGPNSVNGLSITVDHSGNVYSAGSFRGTADFDPEVGTTFLTSTTPNSTDAFISKLNAAGEFIWAKKIGGTYLDHCNSITLDRSSNVYATGVFYNTVDFDPGTGIMNLSSTGVEDVFILKLDESGNFGWVKSMGSYDYDRGTSIFADKNGKVYTTGSFKGAVDFDPGTGTTFLVSAGDFDQFISKLDTAGNFLWAKNIGGTLGDFGYSIAIDSYGNIYTTGEFSGTSDFDPGMGTRNLTSNGSWDIFISKLGPNAVGILENNFENTLNTYPNPTKGALSIYLGASYEEIEVIIRNQLGQELSRKTYRSTNLLPVNIAGKAGLYFVEVISADKKAVLKVVKE
ncbi:MAG: SBBP repeat-containing protein [Vicingaceae bacterium]